ncbi:hypothetical protein M8J75_015130 [Diaphorina citri]|nr:hypothetical protein M8J75_015130 [Diaphorina citri]
MKHEFLALYRPTGQLSSTQAQHTSLHIDQVLVQNPRRNIHIGKTNPRSDSPGESTSEVVQATLAIIAIRDQLKPQREKLTSQIPTTRKLPVKNIESQLLSCYNSAQYTQ